MFLCSQENVQNSSHTLVYEYIINWNYKLQNAQQKYMSFKHVLYVNFINIPDERSFTHWKIYRLIC